jgi:hypothetical protein
MAARFGARARRLLSVGRQRREGRTGAARRTMAQGEPPRPPGPAAANASQVARFMRRLAAECRLLETGSTRKVNC